MRPPLWLDRVHVDHECDHCTAAIDTGEPAAWLPDGGDGALLCFDCGATAEDEAEQDAVAPGR